jgi:hypothetical protein
VLQIGLLGTVLLAFAAILLLWVIGPIGLVVLIVGAVLVWYTVGPGSRSRSSVAEG